MGAYPGLPLDASLIEPNLWVAEIVYFLIETEPVKTAKMAGCRVLDGGAMAVFQEVAVFELFPGQSPVTSKHYLIEAGFEYFI